MHVYVIKMIYNVILIQLTFIRTPTVDPLILNEVNVQFQDSPFIKILKSLTAPDTLIKTVNRGPES